MTTFSDVFKQSFLDAFNSASISTTRIAISLILTTVLAMYIFIVYKVFTRQTFYSKSFNISLVAITIITASIILAMQSSLVISLGMVGALSIIRFRTAIKDPMDLVYLFWAVSTGIICGAGIVELAFMSSALLTAAIVALDFWPIAKAPMILVVNCTDKLKEQEIIKQVRAYGKLTRVKSRTVSSDKLTMTIELRVKEESELIMSVSEIPGVKSVSLISHDGEVTL